MHSYYSDIKQLVTLKGCGSNPEISFVSLTDMSLQSGVSVLRSSRLCK
jgi:hypothetical protein